MYIIDLSKGDAMQDKLIKILEQREKFLSGLISSKNDEVDACVIYAAKFISDNNIWLIDNICYIEINKKFKQVNDAGDKYIEKLKTNLQTYYIDFGGTKRKNIANEVDLLLYNKKVCPPLPNNKNVIFLKNGCFDIFTGKFKEIDNNLTTSIPLQKMEFNFIEKEQEYNETFTQLLKWWTRNNSDNFKFLQQMLGAIFGGYQVERIFNFYGAEGSGKSLLIQLIEKVVGPEFVANTNITSLGNRFGTLQILRKKLLVETDIQNTEEIEPSMLKKISGGDTIQFEFKGGGFLYKKPNTNILISSNDILQFKGTFQGINRRLLIYYFPHSIKNFKQDGIIKKDYKPLKYDELNTIREFIDGVWIFRTDILEPFVSDCLKELHLLYKNNFEFLETIEMADKKKESEMKSNTILFYYDDCFTIETFENDTARKLYYKKGTDLYKDYAVWAETNGYRKKGKNNFYDSLINVIEKNTKWKCDKSKLIYGVGRNFTIFYGDELDEALDFLENGGKNENIKI